MTTAIQCPSCHTRFNVKNGEQLDGKKVRCKKCSSEFRVRLPKTDTPPGGENELDFGDEPLEDRASSDDEFGGFDAAALPSALPSSRKAPSKKAASKGTGKTTFKKDPTGSKRATGHTKKLVLVISAIVGGVVVLAGIGVGGVLVLRNVGKGQKWEAPDNKDYVDFRPDNFGLSCTIPKDWKQSYGGGTGGAPYWCHFDDGTVTIEARESIGGGATGQAMIAMANNADPLAKSKFSPAQALHEEQKRNFVENYHDYDEQPPRPIMTGFGDGRISDFTAGEGAFRFKIKGCRATFLNSIHQFTVTCKCSPAVFKSAKPVFEKVVGSMGVGSGH